ncbi:uncharacterized protein LOC129939193 [Eupeodes corollae]|uniref:uncharacterized protein LOC129939193 n=1 Tax=Eupeodes corollae TaxID=290404 RepID=UPI0024930E51|nr:uncharacterized protein LOC129939193 [Eupeodes corollae]
MSRNSSCSCCKPCDPCCMPYGQSFECYFGSEMEAIPQEIEISDKNALSSEILPVLNKKSSQKNKVLPLTIENLRKCIPTTINNLPFTRITKKVKSDVLYSSWECCKRNGIQDETPQWLVLGRPYRRPGPSYRCVVAYYPSCDCYQCR